MLIKAQQSDKEKILTFLRQEPFYNLFLIADIENFDLQSSLITTFILKNDDEIKSVLLIFGFTLLYFDPFNLISEKLLKEFFDEYNITNVHINQNSFELKRSFFSNSNFKIHKQFLATCKKLKQIDFSLVKKAELEDIESICRGREEITEFDDFRGSYEREYEIYKENFLKNISHNFIIKNEQKVLAHASILASTSQSAMIGGIYCLKEHRKKGYASQVTAALTKYVLENNKTPILFYDNPEAGSIYQKIGFETLGFVYTIKVN
ncbi:GNAT family N-acetyltransferase [Mycoplasmopsis columbina]|uniref:GNAT family N-acetyltransferase n=1 Tax=Mycoplasmopsis columbina TaxID=114881 RepID=UPI0003029069|nr:GNAT family N-acetyltransferase [Mycoplasmopsis columbina]